MKQSSDIKSEKGGYLEHFEKNDMSILDIVNKGK